MDVTESVRITLTTVSGTPINSGQFTLKGGRYSLTILSVGQSGNRDASLQLHGVTFIAPVRRASGTNGNATNTMGLASGSTLNGCVQGDLPPGQYRFTTTGTGTATSLTFTIASIPGIRAGL